MKNIYNAFELRQWIALKGLSFNLIAYRYETCPKGVLTSYYSFRKSRDPYPVVKSRNDFKISIYIQYILIKIDGFSNQARTRSHKKNLWGLSWNFDNFNSNSSLARVLFGVLHCLSIDFGVSYSLGTRFAFT